MIEFESLIFTPIATAIRAQFQGAYVTGEYVPIPASFPAVSIVEMDSVPTRSTQDSGSLENTVDVMYEVNVYSNRTKGKKIEAKSIIALVDTMLQHYGFRRTYCQPVQNMNDATIYRIVARYTATVSKDLVVYR